MHCLWCDAAIIPSVSWETLIFLSEPSELCPSCEETLAFLQGERCSKCSRLSKTDPCPDCREWDKGVNAEDPLVWNHSVFTYNEAMKAMMARWKYRGDYCLGRAFRKYYRQEFGETFSFLPKETSVVPIPLSDERLQERGFNQAEMLASFVPLATRDILTRTHRDKQAKKTRQERLEADNPFNLTERIENPVILADDIYTTGTTLRNAASVLKKQGCPAVYAYTLIRG
ncbi:comF operon protein ComFC [Barrientosiimonas marina]|uniref:ComF family protein n=1 Tax=Lentibacillus kimchii TaxID=1542911 RepID=A0ABW2UZI4_9BACI